MADAPLFIDALVFGGGVAGLWLLDELRRKGYAAVLVENRALGHGQTVGSQGIIHGGLKYMFDGNLNPSAKAISEMPVIWREALGGEREPDLKGVGVRSDGCYIWGTGSIKSRIFMAGSGIALRAAPQPVEKSDWPVALAKVPGKVMKVAEPVIDTVSMVQRFAERNRGTMLLADRERGAEFERDPSGKVKRVKVYVAGLGEAVVFEVGTVVLTAGEGNGALRERLGLPAAAMQRRPLQMVMVRGEGLPKLFGHCVGGPKPRVTVTTAVDSKGRNVWQVGGQVAEDGVGMEAEALVEHAKGELAACVPGVDLRGAEFATYRIDRAEAATSTGQKPDDAHILHEGNVVTGFPTKLALAPRLAERVVEVMPGAKGNAGEVEGMLSGLSAPSVALPPWEGETRWTAGR